VGPGDGPKNGQIAGLGTCTDYTPGWGAVPDREHDVPVIRKNHGGVKHTVAQGDPNGLGDIPQRRASIASLEVHIALQIVQKDVAVAGSRR
jgi:hypothetical protein